MNWESIIIALAGCAFVGDIIMRVLFKSHRDMDGAKAAQAQADAENAQAQADAEEWRRYKEELDNYHVTISTLQNTIQAQAQHIDELIKAHAEERKELEARYDDQKKRLREVQEALLAANEREVGYVRRIGELELELERKRCDTLDCPFRQPPNAHIPPHNGVDIITFHKNKNKNKKKKKKK